MPIKQMKTLTVDGQTYEIVDAQGRAMIEAMSLSDEIKQAILQLAQKVAYIDAGGQTYYNELYRALYPGNLVSISAIYNGVNHQAIVGDALDTLKPYLTVIAHYDDYSSTVVTTYILSGSLSVTGENIITIYYEEGGIGVSTQVGVTTKAISSISAVFTQGTTIVYTNDDLDSLRDMLVVTATYSDNTTATIEDYELIGTLAEGTQTITAFYGEKTATFTVFCTVNGWLYHFSQSILSSGSKDFGFSGPENYSTGVGDTGYSYNHLIDNGVDQGSIKATGLTVDNKPDLSGDFTISGWAKAGNSTTNNVYILSNIKYNTTASGSNLTNALSASSIKNLASGWTADVTGNVTPRYRGVRFQTLSSALAIYLWATDGTNRATVKLTPPSSFDDTIWHHYAVTRKGSTVRIFVDGALICSFTYSKAIYFNTQVTTCAAFAANADSPTTLVTFSVNTYVDDLFIAEYCKWDSAFDTSTILY